MVWRATSKTSTRELLAPCGAQITFLPLFLFGLLELNDIMIVREMLKCLAYNIPWYIAIADTRPPRILLQLLSSGLGVSLYFYYSTSNLDVCRPVRSLVDCQIRLLGGAFSRRGARASAPGVFPRHVDEGRASFPNSALAPTVNAKSPL